MAANYPNADPSFGTKATGNTIEAAHVNALQDEVVAIGAALRGTLAHALTTNGQVVFPAAQNASAGVNTLDDYEEGTWTPAVGGTATYTVQTGQYTKVGNLVYARCNLVINAIGSGSTGIISGLPFSAAAISPGSVGYFASLANNHVWVGCYALGTDVHITGITGAGGTTTDPAVVFGNGTNVYITVMFYV